MRRLRHAKTLRYAGLPGISVEGESEVIVRRYTSPWRVVLSILGTAVALIAIALTLALGVIPLASGGRAMTVLTGSMEPLLHPGDVAVVGGIDPSEVCASVTVGQIVSYLPLPNDPSVTTHRVVAKTIGNFDDGYPCRLTVKGDANGEADPPVSPAQVRGVYLYNVPWLGWLVNAAQHNRMAVMLVVVVIFLAMAAWSFFVPGRRRIIASYESVPEGADGGAAAADVVGGGDAADAAPQAGERKVSGIEELLL